MPRDISSVGFPFAVGLGPEFVYLPTLLHFYSGHAIEVLPVVLH